MCVIRLITLISCALVNGPLAYAVAIETVRIGNPSNQADTRYIDEHHPSGVGSVAYTFRMGMTEVTNSQYVEFLNAVAASDPYELYSTSMDSETYGGIVRIGVPGSFSYAVKGPALSGSYTYEGKPAVYVSSGDAMRFANWLHNGQPSGLQDATTTEDGAYTLNGATTSEALGMVTRNAGARWWLPSENEWYKAAYHKNDGVTGNYWDYPTGTDVVPNNNPPSADNGNSANFYNNSYTTGNPSYPLTDAGAYVLSESPYGTLDQGGNLWEWNETLFDGVSRGLRGGFWYAYTELDYYFLHASSGFGTDPSDEISYVGFRVASVIPEPSSVTFCVITAWILALRKTDGILNHSVVSVCTRSRISARVYRVPSSSAMRRLISARCSSVIPMGPVGSPDDDNSP